jgi:peptide/nickel transport system substrate-binding protein
MRAWFRLLAVAAIAATSFATTTARAQLPALVDPPMFAEAVKAGKLPPVEQRVPLEPSVVTFDGTTRVIGRHGGMITQLMERSSDIKRMSAFGYTRLVGYTPDYRLQADILKSYEVKEGREFTFVLRKGHRWSDGQPFTTEDFRYFWEDMVLNKEMSPEGAPMEMQVRGQPPKVEIIDKETIRFTWDRPNPFFLPALAAATPLMIYRPAHYLKRFHKRYVKAEKLNELVAKRKRREWVDLHFNRDRTARLDNPEIPVLDPWVNTTPSPSERFIFERNPYFHRIDSEGRQLPYVDRVAVTIAASKLIPAKVGAGEVELQSRALQFNNYTVLKRSEAREDYKVRLWRNARGSQVALYPNLNVADPEWRELMRDVRVRRALSLAIDRREINMVIYYGLAKESANTVIAASPLFRPELRHAWASFDLAQANRLLDEVGLVKRDSRGVRLMSDGRPLEIIVETAGEGPEHADVLELVRDTWIKAGVALFIKPQTREVMRRRVKAGMATMSVFYGIDNGVANAATPPDEVAPTQEQQLQWPQWGLWHASSGQNGSKPDLPEAVRLGELYDAWTASTTEDERSRIWSQMLQINADQVYSIGIINTVPQPIVVSNRLRNVPEDALYSWEPGAHFGVFRPDTFWLVDAKQGS